MPFKIKNIIFSSIGQKIKKFSPANLLKETNGSFSNYSQQWWNSEGSMAMLHRLNLVRLEYIHNALSRHYGHDCENNGRITLADVGCGGGILSIPLARLGYEVLGMDISPELIDVAKSVADSQQLRNVNFVVTNLVEEAPKQKVDVLMAMEIIEHLSSEQDKQSFFNNCIQMINPGGMIFIATINRNFLSFCKAIVAAEYILNYVPRGTHKYSDFLTPHEVLQFVIKAAGERKFRMHDIVGVEYNFLADTLQFSKKIDTNYMICLQID